MFELKVIKWDEYPAYKTMVHSTKSHLSWTNIASAMNFCETPDIQALKNGSYYAHHIFPYFFSLLDTMFVDIQH